MLATSSSSNFTPFRQRAGRIGSCGGFSLCVALSTDNAACVVVFQYISFRRVSFLRFEEFVNLIFPSPFWSSHWSWC